MSLVAMSLVQSAATANSPDADLADFRLDQTQGELEKMPRGPERDCLAGLLANRRGQVPVVNLRANGVALPFTLDTGASGTDLSVRYYERFKDSDLSWKQDEDYGVGVGGSIKRKIYKQPLLRLAVGDKIALLRDVSITPRKMNAGLDELYGNIGQDTFANFKSFTLDFAEMIFKVGDPISQQTPQ